MLFTCSTFSIFTTLSTWSTLLHLLPLLSPVSLASAASSSSSEVDSFLLAINASLEQIRRLFNANNNARANLRVNYKRKIMKLKAGVENVYRLKRTIRSHPILSEIVIHFLIYTSSAAHLIYSQGYPSNHHHHNTLFFPGLRTCLLAPFSDHFVSPISPLCKHHSLDTWRR